MHLGCIPAAGWDYHLCSPDRLALIQSRLNGRGDLSLTFLHLRRFRLQQVLYARVLFTTVDKKPRTVYCSLYLHLFPLIPFKIPL